MLQPQAELNEALLHFRAGPTPYNGHNIIMGQDRDKGPGPYTKGKRPAPLPPPLKSKKGIVPTPTPAPPRGQNPYEFAREEKGPGPNQLTRKGAGPNKPKGPRELGFLWVFIILLLSRCRPEPIKVPFPPVWPGSAGRCLLVDDGVRAGMQLLQVNGQNVAHIGASHS